METISPSLTRMRTRICITYEDFVPFPSFRMPCHAHLQSQSHYTWIHVEHTETVCNVYICLRAFLMK